MSGFTQKLLLIDGHALLHRAFHALPAMSNSKGFPTGAIFGFFSMLFKALADIKPTHALVCFDIPGKTFRDTLAADYKAHRKPTPDELTMQLPKVKEILVALDIPVYEKEGYEADDLLGIISRKTGKDVLNIIVTGDLDLLQLINKNTEVYRFKIGFSDIVIYDEAKMKEQYGLRPHQWVDYKALRGDPSDNIPGVLGIGEKTALELIKEFGSINNLYTALEDGEHKLKPGTTKKLVEGKAKAFLSYDLAHINCDNDKVEFNFEATNLGDYDQSKVVALLQELEIKALMQRLPKTSKQSVSTVEEKPVVAQKKNKIIHSAQEAMLAAYLLNPGLREYDITDWSKLASLLEEKDLLKIFQEIEVPLISVLEAMQKRGIKLDLPWLAELSKKLAKRIDQLIKQIHKLAGEEFNISSPKQLREILFEKLMIPTENLKKNKKSGGLSTAAGELEKLRGVHPIVDLLFEYRELTKLKSTYIDALPQLVSKEDSRLHTSYSQTIAATGRLSSSNPNLQNIPIRTDLGNEVRKAFIADKGDVLLSVDYSQIELRIAASLSDDKEMIKIFEQGGDFHTATASRIFGIKESEVTASQRRDAKTINFSVLYGVSAFGLSERSSMSRAEASEHIKKYYEVFSKLKKYIDSIIKAVHERGFVTNPIGRIRYFPDINSPNFGLRTAAERAAVNMPIQSLAADIIKMSMIQIEKELPEARMLLSVHDELVFEIKKDKIEKFASQIKTIMESTHKLKVPLVVDVKIGSNWAKMEKI